MVIDWTEKIPTVDEVGVVTAVAGRLLYLRLGG
jgi:hypothetical protein